MKIRDLMTPNPIRIALEAPVAEIARILTEGASCGRRASGAARIGLGRPKENFYRSVFRRRAPGTDKAKGRTAEQVMTREVLTVAPEDHVTVAARLLADHGIKSLPVIEHERLIGMISRFDLVKRLASAPEIFNPMRKN